MPLHLLQKKSWNIYAPKNIERIKRAEAEQAAKEAEEERRMQEHDAARRLAILRGEILPEAVAEAPIEPSPKRSREDSSAKDSYRKRRRMAGEDDTDRDLRLAREDMEGRAKPRDVPRKIKSVDAPIVDRDGHINLFPIDPRVQARAEKNAEVEAEKARKKREMEDQYTMRFSNAAGRDGLKERPWYSSKDRLGPKEEDEYAQGKDAWGRPDPARKEREKMRMGASDPLAFMQKAQVQLKKTERDRKDWAVERERELKRLREVERRERREKRKKRRRTERKDRDEEDGLEGFDLDAR